MFDHIGIETYAHITEKVPMVYMAYIYLYPMLFFNDFQCLY